MKFHIKEIVRVVCLFIFLYLFAGDLFCQSSKDLDKRKKENLQELSLAKDLLEKTGKSKNNTLNQLNLIQQNIELRSQIVDNISHELSFLKTDIERNNIEIKRLENRISILKGDYAKLIVATSRNLDKDYALLYIYSSQDFNQAYQRIKYLKYLARYRMDIANELKGEELNLKNRIVELNANKKNNESLLLERKRELISLDNDKKQNVLLIHTLRSREVELKKDIQKRERIQAEIEKEIRRIIEEEAAKAKLAKRTNVLSAEEKLLSSEFAKNIGKLPWPSERGIVTCIYGEQNHPILKGIKIKSNGIDINTGEGAKIRCVFDGEVTKVIAILGANYTVIIKHGDFRTVYQNLVDVKVKAGDKIKTKAVIGTVFTDQEDVSKFHFEVWKDKLTQNPEVWLSR